ncbi:MAG TPA: sugar ABC transporter permease [Tepidisphaeraceae bacterium]|jgi:ABC-type sugar transport system permease subunit|nr:sugar ABC transporter permease [Tepidisphaeraceae bacterium]
MTTAASTNAATGIITRKKPVGVARSRRGAKLVHRTRLYLVLFALMLPTLLGMLLFTYYPQWGAVKYSLYNWDGDKISEFIGFKNFVDAFTRDALFWSSFQLVGILLVANLFKMWPSIFAAVALHRIRSDRWQYIYRVLFVIPMIIPALVGLLVWKTFYDSTTGVLNKFLNGTGLMGVLNWLDTAMPKVAATLSPVREAVIDPLGGVWGLAIIGALILFTQKTIRSAMRAWVGWMFLSFAAAWAYWDVLSGSLQQVLGNPVLVVVGVVVVAFLIMCAVAIALAALRQRVNTGWHTWAGALALTAASFFLLATMIWTTPTQAFLTGAPAWLGHSKLIIPAIIFWGFPWVGTVGVLIYLAGLQNISQDVYEAAEIDGLGSIGKLWSLELPLILTQVRINLIFMTIGTLGDYYLIFLLLGPDGGPGNVGMVPGLYMYKSAFVEGRFGYACALGMVLFVLILAITIVYQKYVKVDK